MEVKNKMVRIYREVPKRAKNSIVAQINKLISKYGEKSVRLVVTKEFQKSFRQKQLEEEIEKREDELKELKQRVSK